MICRSCSKRGGCGALSEQDRRCQTESLPDLCPALAAELLVQPFSSVTERLVALMLCTVRGRSLFVPMERDGCHFIGKGRIGLFATCEGCWKGTQRGSHFLPPLKAVCHAVGSFVSLQRLALIVATLLFPRQLSNMMKVFN